MDTATKNAKDIQQAALTLGSRQMSGQQNVSKVSGNVKTQGGDFSNAMEFTDVAESISLMNAGLKKRNVIIAVREAISQEDAEQNG